MPDENLSREELREFIDKRVEERMEDEKERIREEIRREESGSDRKHRNNNDFSRRDFLKMLGLGAGGLALSSTVSGAWSIVQPSADGVSDLKSSDVADNSVDSSKIQDSSITTSDLNFSPVIDENDLTGGDNIDTSSGSIDVSPQGDGSGLDADTLDGNEPSDIAGDKSGYRGLATTVVSTNTARSDSVHVEQTSVRPSYSDARRWFNSFYVSRVAGASVTAKLMVDGSTFASTTDTANVFGNSVVGRTSVNGSQNVTAYVKVDNDTKTNMTVSASLGAFY